MLRKLSGTMIRNLTPFSKNLLASGRMKFSTGPSNNPFGEKKVYTDNVQSQIKAGEVVTKNVGIHKFVTRIYNTTALSVIGALGGAYVGMTIPALMMSPLATSLIGTLVAIGSFVGVQSMRPQHVVENVLGAPNPILKTQNSVSRILLYSLGVLSLGISTSPLFAYMQMAHPSVITASLGVTLGIFGGASAISYALPKDQMLGYGKIFGGALLGLIGTQLVGLGSAYFMGPNALSSLLFNINNYAGILLFMGMIGYDTHVAIKEYELGNADHLVVSVQMLLNFWNILVRVMQIMSQFND